MRHRHDDHFVRLRNDLKGITSLKNHFFVIQRMKKASQYNTKKKRHDELINLYTNCCSEMWPTNTVSSKTNATLDDGGTSFIVPALRDPPRLKKMRKDTLDPPIHTDTFTLVATNELHCGWSQRRQFPRHVLKDPSEHVRTA